MTLSFRGLRTEPWILNGYESGRDGGSKRYFPSLCLQNQMQADGALSSRPPQRRPAIWSGHNSAVMALHYTDKEMEGNRAASGLLPGKRAIFVQ